MHDTVVSPARANESFLLKFPGFFVYIFNTVAQVFVDIEFILETQIDRFIWELLFRFENGHCIFPVHHTDNYRGFTVLCLESVTGVDVFGCNWVIGTFEDGVGDVDNLRLEFVVRKVCGNTRDLKVFPSGRKRTTRQFVSLVQLLSGSTLGKIDECRLK